MGRIVVARFLALPLRTFARRVQNLEQAPLFPALRNVVRCANLSGQPPFAEGEASNDLLGAAQRSGDTVVWRYASAAFDREYVFEEEALAHHLRRSDPALTRLVSCLRLVNTRNRLTHALVQALIEAQREYVLTGDPLHKKPLSQNALSGRIRASGACPVHADPSRVSRLIRHIAIQLPCGQVARLRTLCPAPREVQRNFVSEVIRQEQVRMIDDGSLVPMTDREIAALVQRDFGARLLPRTVAYIRQDLDIPGSRERGRRSEYLSMTVGFSAVLPLTREILHEHVPAVPGVYELRREVTAPPTCPIIYIGSARDVRKRLFDHLRGYSGNRVLTAQVQDGARFRYRPVAVHWRETERALYGAFLATFGAAPLANRMSP